MPDLDPHFSRLVYEALDKFFKGAAGVEKLDLHPEAPPIAALLSDVVYSASLGFGGDKVKGALIFTTEAEFLRATNPRRQHRVKFTMDDNRDWVGETTNQIVGSIKRLLLSYGVTCNLGVPTVIQGLDLFVQGLGGKSSTYWVQIEDYFAKVTVVANFDASVDFQQKSTEQEGMKGGGSVLFPDDSHNPTGNT